MQIVKLERPGKNTLDEDSEELNIDLDDDSANKKVNATQFNQELTSKLQKKKLNAYDKLLSFNETRTLYLITY